MNKILLSGYVGKDPELTYTSSGSAVAKFSLGVSRRWKDKNSGEMVKDTTWFNIIAWERLAETCSNYVHKGSHLFVEGRMTMREYTDKDNVQRRVHEVVITEMELLSTRGDSEHSAAPQGEAAAPAGELHDNDDFPF